VENWANFAHEQSLSMAIASADAVPLSQNMTLVTMTTTVLSVVKVVSREDPLLSLQGRDGPPRRWFCPSDDVAAKTFKSFDGVTLDQEGLPVVVIKIHFSCKARARLYQHLHTGQGLENCPRAKVQ
jgi:hypothetical protein